MLAHYFGFGEDPFGATPDPRYLYASQTHREALASLQYAFRSNRGFTALIAPPGMGKTTLLFEFLQRVRDMARTAFLFNSLCDPADLLRNILTEIGLIPHDSLGSMLQQLNHELLETARTGRRFVVVVDEAQNLNEPTLETLRLLTNFETTRSKLMQIVLSGQPQLANTLLRPGLVQLRQRVSTFCRLEPFAPDEIRAYIDHRLAVAGYKGASLFTADALSRIVEASQGIPRNINTICFNALSLCCALKKQRVDLPVLDEVLRDLQPEVQRPGEPEKESPAAYVETEPPQERERSGRLSRTRVPAIAAVSLLAVCGGFWATSLFSGGLDRSDKEVLLPVPAPKPPAPVVAPAAKDANPDAIEVTVNPEQTLSGISVRTLGAYDDALLRRIEELNPGLQNPNMIHPGEKLLLPRHHSSDSRSEEKANE